MTRDKFDQLITESGIPMFYREDFELFPHQIRLFCQEKYRFLVEDFIWRQVPVRIWIEIITENYDYRAYRHPRFTFRDHLKDCFGFIEIPGWIIWAFGLGVGTGIITGMVD